MPRDCFVIMPFSGTASCTEDEWTQVFEQVLKPAVESAGLDYVCRRSMATRGNIVGAIVQDLNDSHVVIADLTDRNANVFYELGVRHAAKDRSILIAQKKEDIPFDLQAYAYHVYGWKTPEDLKALTDKIRQLLADIDSNPTRPDNPVSDFLKVRRPAEVEVAAAPVAPVDVPIAQPLAGLGAEGLDVQKLVAALVERSRPQDARTIYRLTKTELLPLINNTLKSLNEKGKGGQVTKDQIFGQAMEYIAAFEPITNTIEHFGLASTQESWKAGLETTMRLAGNLITISERPQSGQVIKYAQGAPALMAWRMLCLCGAKAIDEDGSDIMRYIMTGPIEVEEATGKFSNRPLIERRDLFYPDAFLGYANFPMKYAAELWNRNKYLQSYFDSNDNYHMAATKFFIILVLAAKPNERGYPMFPGYRLLPQTGRAMSALTSRIFSSNAYLEAVAGAMGLTGATLKETWAERVKSINAVSTDGWPHLMDDTLFPAEFGQEVE
ncbi:hypothetical protein ACFLVN_03655 [Chloroflexota bacterium]